MSKQKMLQVIYERTFEHMQQLSISTYKASMDNKKFNFERYFESSYKTIINYSLEYLDTDCEKFKDVYYKYFKDVYDLSEKCAMTFITIGTSIRLELFNWWKDNWKEFLNQIMELHT